MNTYSAVLLDIDGTLVDSKMQVSANTKRLLNRLEKRGIPIVLCSARAPSGVELVEQQVGLNSPIVCFGGSLILDENRGILEDKGIEGEAAIRFKQFVADAFQDLTVCSYMYDVWLVDNLSDPYIQLLMERNPTSMAIVGSLEAALRTETHVHKLMCMGQAQTIRNAQAVVQQKFPDLEFVRSGNVFLEVLCKGASKLTAMERIREYYHVDLEKVVAIGDYYVDIDMIRSAGLGIAMGNAPEEVKQAAKRVTTSCEEEGVYIALKSVRFAPCENTVHSDGKVDNL